MSARQKLQVLLACGALAASASAQTAAAAEPQAAPAGPQTETAAPEPAAEATATQPVSTTATETVPAGTTSGEPAPSTPQVQTQVLQAITPSTPGKPAGKHSKAGETKTTTSPSEEELKAAKGRQPARAPGSLTPALPLDLAGGLSQLPGFFIESFAVPPFLLPIFQAAGTAYEIPWQVLAAINEVETDYGRDLSVSSAGAEGWMQFLPASWAQYGVDANGTGYEDPYNPADAIFAAARYLRAAGGAKDIRSAIFAYNHSQAYVESVMLRAQLLAGTPSELLGAITGLTEAHFPVHASAHYDDGFPSVAGKQVVGTTIYSTAGAPVIAVQDGQVVQIGSSAALGHFLVLRDAFGNTYTYAHLGSVAPEYPVLAPQVNSSVPSRVAAQPDEAAPTAPASAGVQPRSPLSEGAAVSGLALGSSAGLEAAPTKPSAPPVLPAAANPSVTEFRSGPDDVFLHPLQAGVQVIAGTVLGHVADGTDDPAEGGPHIIFQIRPAGLGAPLIDPKPILDGWVALENSSVFHAKGENPFLATSPTIGQVLLESKQQLEPQVLRDAGIRLSRCGREDVQAGRVDKRVLATLEYLAVSGLSPRAGGLECTATRASAANASAAESIESVNITAINGSPVAGHQGPGSAADEAVRKLLMLQGASRPLQIESLMSYPGSHVAVTSASAGAAIKVAFAGAPELQGQAGGLAHTAAAGGSQLSPSDWIRLVARLGEIPDPTVSAAPSSAAIPDSASAGKEAGNGNN
jgi:murein DD-endopeptidase MepM/ murein hydrolase activator NlpD